MLRNWKTSPGLAITALVAVTAVWGWTFVIVKDAIARMPVMDFLAVRFTLAVVIMFILRPASLHHISGQSWRHGIILGFLLGMSYVTQTFGLSTVSPAVSGFITGMAVVFTPVLSWALLRRKISRNAWIAVALALVGLALLSLHGWAFGSGELLTVGCAMFVAFHIIGLGEWSSKHDPYSLTLVQLGTIAVISLAAATPGGITLPPDAETWRTVAITAVLATAFAFIVQTWAQSILTPTLTAVVFTMEPVFAGVFSVIAGGDSLTFRLIIGALCVLLAMLIAQIKTIKVR
ncbi:MAG: permease [Chloroflexi bacterium RBG_16_50_11]|nr:MAG: permease [Chloroflexi bacterium RBG_16_50_11]